MISSLDPAAGRPKYVNLPTPPPGEFISLVPRRCSTNVISLISKHILQIICLWALFVKFSQVNATRMKPVHEPMLTQFYINMSSLGDNELKDSNTNLGWILRDYQMRYMKPLPQYTHYQCNKIQNAHLFLHEALNVFQSMCISTYRLTIIGQH